MPARGARHILESPRAGRSGAAGKPTPVRGAAGYPEAVSMTRAPARSGLLHVAAHLLLLVGVFTMNNVLTTAGHDSMPVATHATTSTSDGMSASVAAARVERLVAPGPTMPDMGGCEGAMLLCGAMIALLVVISSRWQRRGRPLKWPELLRWAPRRIPRIATRLVLVARRPVLVMRC